MARGNETYCKNGHELTEENCVPSQWKKGLRRCILCDRARKEKYRRDAGILPRHKTHCPKGHALVEGNLRKGKRECLICHRERELARNRAKGTMPRVQATHCSKGHPLVEGNLRTGKFECLTCHREREKTRYHANPQKAIDAAVRWHKENREAYNVRCKRWRNENPEKRKRRISRDKTTQEYVSLILGDRCVYCGSSVKHIDHIVPLASGGAKTWDNLAPACASCNLSKNDRPLWLYLLEQKVMP